MINLITGLPGNGKTLFVIDLVQRLAAKENRPVYYSRIPELKIPGWTEIDPFEWFLCPPRSIIVIDEIQKSANPDDPKSPTLFGLRKRGDPVPKWASELETHRHLGVDLFLLTQDPMLVDSHDRKFAQTHYHLMRKWGMAKSKVHRFNNGVRPNVASPAGRTGSVASTFAFPKRLYGVYKSADEHTHKVSIPFRVILFWCLPFILIGLAYLAWTRIDPSRKAVAPPPGAATPQTLSAAPGRRGRDNREPLSRAEYVAQFEPRVAGLAYTAPVYDEVTKPMQAPYPAACLELKVQPGSELKDRCSCYTQQGTALELPADMCRSIARGGFFVAWEKPARDGSAGRVLTGVQPVAPAPSVGTLGGDPRAHILKGTAP